MPRSAAPHGPVNVGLVKGRHVVSKRVNSFCR